MTRFLILGAGRMAEAIAYDLARWKGTERVTVAARDARAVRAVQRVAKKKNVVGARLNLKDNTQTLSLLHKHDVAISAIPYMYNYDLAKKSLAAGTHFIDLGGNNAVVKKQFTLDKQAKKKRIAIVPDAGLAPGMVGTIVAAGLQSFPKIREVDEVKVRVGGLPQNPQGPLQYKLVFSVNGLINEYKEPAVVLHNKKIKRIDSLNDIEKIHFPTLGWLEAFTTSGGTSTMPNTFKGMIKHLDYKTIRYPGHAAKMRLLFTLGLADEKPLIVGGVPVTPRTMLQKVLEETLQYKDKDMVLLRVKVATAKKQVLYELIDKEQKGLTAMQRCTGFPAAIIAEMIADKRIKNKGVLKHELDIPPNQFIDELHKRSIKLQRKEGNV